jgi:hypothetical protein
MHSRAGPVTLLSAFQADNDTLSKRALKGMAEASTGLVVTPNTLTET